MWIPLLILAAVSFTISYAATGFLVRYLRRKAVMDMPNERSNHQTPIPRGGGLAVTGVILLGLAGASAAHAYLRPEIWIAMACMALLAVISWRDDRSPLPARWRLLAQGAVVGASLALIFPELRLSGGWLPGWLDMALAALLWLWFINLYNFMDGIDGITGAETLHLCLGVFAVTLLAALPPQLAFYAVLTAFATLGFLMHNWHPAKIFLGDVGSIPLGYLLGFLLLSLAEQGFALPALILPLYYLADSGLTILARLRDGEKIWLPHSRHAYQRAVRAGRSHASVVCSIIAGNIVLLALALACVLDSGRDILYTGLSMGVVLALILHLVKKTP